MVYNLENKEISIILSKNISKEKKLEVKKEKKNFQNFTSIRQQPYCYTGNSSQQKPASNRKGNLSHSCTWPYSICNRLLKGPSAA